MTEIFNYANAPLIITALFVSIVLIVFLYVKRSYRNKEKITDDFLEHIEMVSGAGRKKKVTKDPVTMWCDFFGDNFKKAGWVNIHVTNKRVGFSVFLVTFVFYCVITLFTFNVGIALVPIVAGYLFLFLVMEQAIETRKEIFDDQVPIFLSLLKANIRAGETPERALANAIDETEYPLHEELKNARALIDLGSFSVAIQQLRKNTQSNTLRFLCGCIELSAKVGTNLEHQISTIEEMLENNRQLKRKLKVAISKNTPLLMLSAILIPAMFIFQYFFNEQSRDFWFVVPISWIAFVLAIGIYLGGVFASKYITKKTGEF